MDRQGRDVSEINICNSRIYILLQDGLLIIDPMCPPNNSEGFIKLSRVVYVKEPFCKFIILKQT